MSETPGLLFFSSNFNTFIAVVFYIDIYISEISTNSHVLECFCITYCIQTQFKLPRILYTIVRCLFFGSFMYERSSRGIKSAARLPL